MRRITSLIFGDGSFEGRVSQTVINTLQATVQSKKYNEMKSHLGKTATTLKKINLALHNLERNKKAFRKDSPDYQKYKDAIYAIKHVLKFVAKIYKSRKIINDKVYRGLHNIVHEQVIIEESLGAAI